MSDPRRVSFLVAGVQKGGTTALFHYLDDLAGVQMAPAKEVHFFDVEAGVDWARPDYEPLHAAFPAVDGRPRGEATPIYLYWPNCLERIARYDPAMKLILLFRDPVERAWSQWKMEYARGWETRPFAWCVREGRARVDSPEAPGFHRVFSYVERGFYGAQLERLLAIFPRGQALLLRSEDLDRRPDETLGRICRFLGVAPPAAAVTPRRELVARDIDYGAPISAADRAYLREVFAEDLRRFAALSGLPVEGWLAGEPASAPPAAPERGIWSRLRALRH
ncbi:MAG: sulfotransferase [Phenylobacterium sp.]|nr:sulfotransferase [Phenylobacterium sp.]